MEKIEQARWVVKAFSHLKRETGLWATAGEKDAADDLMSQMITENLLLKSLGYTLDDDGRLVKYKPLVGLERERIDLAIKAGKGDTKAAQRLLEVWAGETEDLTLSKSAV